MQIGTRNAGATNSFSLARLCGATCLSIACSLTRTLLRICKMLALSTPSISCWPANRYSFGHVGLRGGQSATGLWVSARLDTYAGIFEYMPSGFVHSLKSRFSGLALD